MSTPDGEIYTFPSRDNTVGQKKGECGLELPFVDGGSEDEGGSSGASMINQYDGRKIRRIEQRRRQSEKEEEKNREESKMKLGPGPYADWAYEEVLARNPRYAESLMGQENGIIRRRSSYNG